MLQGTSLMPCLNLHQDLTVVGRNLRHRDPQGTQLSMKALLGGVTKSSRPHGRLSPRRSKSHPQPAFKLPDFRLHAPVAGRIVA